MDFRLLTFYVLKNKDLKEKIVIVQIVQVNFSKKNRC